MTKTNEKIHVLADESLDGIKREYVEVDREAKVGEKIIAIEESLPYFCEGDYGEVIAVWCGDVSAKFESNYDNKSWFISHERYNVLEPTNIVHIDGDRYEMVDREAEVGEKVIVTKSDDFPIGFVDFVKKFDDFFDDGSFFLNKGVPGEDFLDVDVDDYRVLVPAESSEEEPRPSDPIDVIANLATRVAELERQIKKLNAALPEDMELRSESTQRYLALQDEIDTLHKDNRMLGEELARLDKGVHAQSQRHLYRQQEIERVWERMDRIESEMETLKYAAKETDGKVAHLESDSDTRLFTAEEVIALLNEMRERQ